MKICFSCRWNGTQTRSNVQLRTPPTEPKTCRRRRRKPRTCLSESEFTKGLGLSLPAIKKITAHYKASERGQSPARLSGVVFLLREKTNRNTPIEPSLAWWLSSLNRNETGRILSFFQENSATFTSMLASHLLTQQLELPSAPSRKYSRFQRLSMCSRLLILILTPFYGCYGNSC